MIDYITKKRVVVEFDINSCPFIEITEYNDADKLEDILHEEFYLFFLVSFPEELKENGGRRFHFSQIINTSALQEILNSISLNEQE